MDSLTLVILGEYLREWRKKHRFRLRDIAEVAGCSVGSVSRFESGERDSCKMILAYIYLGCDVTTIVEDIMSYIYPGCDEEDIMR